MTCHCLLKTVTYMIETTGKNVHDVVVKLQEGIDRISTWFSQNKLTVNASKCCSMLIGSNHKVRNDVTRNSLGLVLNGVLIENRDNYTYLGVQIDSLLNFD